MQRRMSAGLAKYAPEIKVVNFASYEAEIVRGLIYREEIKGMWSVDRYIELLMGEIPRLTDDKNGYGPTGKNFIAHVDIPEEVQKAFERLKEAFPSGIRAADSRYAG